MKKFKTARESRVVISELMLPSHSNFSGKIHGGYILSLMDQIAFACGSKHSETYCVTASVDKVDFLKPIEVGELVTMKASVNNVGKTSMVVGVRVESENIMTGKVKHCNSSYFTMVAKNDQGSSVPVPGLILENETAVRRFVRSIIRKEDAKSRRDRFKASEFQLEDHLELLKEYNVQIDL
ncbi:acyl-CoA thioesterase [Aquimarina sp. AD1]|uniref:acyl-CoA thioesterase n=1 Tax=Aquimarina sp. (strain AD1) TaxID=1714848 RepID=UPI000E48181C|nr:acyl-CoA thioesterase [Aquimarina sp. AD1]AXT55843.1 acyl-CoA thioesterase [Aquimarina sp. AD1]RKN29731.1 hotdog fold thioesterase [Aquimarina sp. AD1]